ncbi:JNK1/MAPK8-associated membrane protein [Cimex lectularius]|uniref:JNK1/MAPK8-associated membrane protein n=1 Tax=Cimex lectularius TaxID=79782 RepID=A0A8I6RF24_CIMLE|nr:JNK1/MAPK8-associated membrane protein [Cimex lectularius]XP_014242606.1 JNK1/MAPK8-associated membrane protein [Cimex lectularius]XP_014242607.1 JNK1/MAPK8-associated membrane protein [Cimex lectularius]
MIKCPGLYCGRMPLGNGTWGECGACERGFRANDSSLCVPCGEKPVFYDWLYLGFMTFSPLVLHWFSIDNTTPFRGKLSQGALVLHLSALLETVLAALITLLLVEPFGELDLKSCPVKSLSDWYTLFHNPRPNYTELLHCTQEAVYPLHTMVFVFYGTSVLTMILLRPWLVKFFRLKTGGVTIYAALYFFPILAVFHAVFGGIIYYTFPYIVIVLSVISNAAHFAFKMDQSMTFLVISTVTDVRNLIIVLGHWVVHGYGIISLTQLGEPVLHGAFLCLVPLPALFYIVTARFTDPHKLHTD